MLPLYRCRVWFVKRVFVDTIAALSDNAIVRSGDHSFIAPSPSGRPYRAHTQRGPGGEATIGSTPDPRQAEQLRLRLKPPTARPWFWRFYARRLEREVMLLRMRVKALEETRRA